MDIAEDLTKQFREQQQKYAYYLIALCVTAIGFSIAKTFDLPLSKSQIPLGAAVLSWGLSIGKGLAFIRRTIAALYKNKALLDVQAGTHPLSGTNPQAIKIGEEALIKILEQDSEKASDHATWQQRFFYLGIVFFVGWHVYEMYLRSLV
jgi:hypothetical protein